MPITIEELTAEVVPEPRSAPEPQERREGAPLRDSIQEQVRAALSRQQRRAERLSDR